MDELCVKSIGAEMMEYDAAMVKTCWERVDMVVVSWESLSMISG